jgi:lycopene cyclase domain-containing protein
MCCLRNSINIKTMEWDNYTYLLLMVGTILVPLLLSFEKDVRYFKKWKYLFPAIFLTGVFFIIWDVIFTKNSIWSFNPQFLTGIYILNLPLEEWLFFIAVPFSCTFIYEVIKVKMPHYEKPQIFSYFTIFVVLVSFLLFVFNLDRRYTSLNFLFLGLYGGYIYLSKWFKPYYSKFYLAWLIGLIPFLVVNGILTGMPVVEYNPEHNLGIRIFTIPVEDAGYFLLLFLMVVSIYEYLTKKKFY